MKHSIGQWCAAVTASVCVGGAVALVIGATLAVGSRLYQVAPGLTGWPLAVGALPGAGVTVHFLRLFWLGELDSRDIWTAVGKAFVAFGDD